MQWFENYFSFNDLKGHHLFVKTLIKDVKDVNNEKIKSLILIRKKIRKEKWIFTFFMTLFTLGLFAGFASIIFFFLNNHIHIKLISFLSVFSYLLLIILLKIVMKMRREKIFDSHGLSRELNEIFSNLSTPEFNGFWYRHLREGNTPIRMIIMNNFNVTDDQNYEWGKLDKTSDIRADSSIGWNKNKIGSLNTNWLKLNFIKYGWGLYSKQTILFGIDSAIYLIAASEQED